MSSLVRRAATRYEYKCPQLRYARTSAVVSAEERGERVIGLELRAKVKRERASRDTEAMKLSVITAHDRRRQIGDVRKF